MAEVAALELQIGAKVDKAVAGLQQFDKSLFQLQEELKTFKAAQETTFDPKQFAQYGQKIQSITAQIKSRFESMDREVEQTGTTMGRMNKSASSATNSLFALSGVVQDAPYGFRAIANNITFFTQQMAYSSKEAGGFMAALKAVGGAMLGPAGIIFAISAATSLITYFLGKTDKAKDKVDELKVTVGTLSDSLLKGSQNAQKSAVNLDLLYKAATDVNRSMTERIAAVKELQSKYPNYLGNLSQEQILAGKAADAYYALKNQIIATARAKAAQETIIENEKQRLALETKLQKLGAQRNQLEARISATTARASSALSTNAQGYNSSAIAVTALNLKLNSLNKEINKTVNQYNQLTNADLKLTNSINAVDLTKKFGGSPGPKGKNDNTSQAVDVLNGRLQAARNAMRSFSDESSEEINSTLIPSLVNIQRNVTAIQPITDHVNVKLVAMAQIVSNDLLNGFEDVFSAVANGSSVMQALVREVEQVAIKLAAAAASAAALSAISRSGSGLGSGISKLFGGGGFGSILKGLLGIPLASGGIAYGPTPALVGEYPGARTNPEVVAPLDKLKAILGEAGGTKQIRVSGEFVQRGRDLVAVINNQNRVGKIL